MSWTSPLTVAVRMRPWAGRAPAAAFSASMNGSRYATAFFITRALRTTWGRNIRPEPNRSPTTFIPCMSGPSMTCNGRPYFRRASSVSASMKSVMPLMRAWLRRCSTVPWRHSASAAAVSSFGLTPSANLTRRSVASGRRFRIKSSTSSRSGWGISSYTSSRPGFTMPMSSPARMAWYRKAE